ncbi:uncharacterized protein BDW47DRAFT_111189 [Aspergillus candidus]|uniref:SPT2 chromatin protein-domain-containing protein n=1 Tax=Aspergillus candidus TaxID=41067 RepID=A0A2I2F2X0_ASPCN|nr:hypothetical protein BDW47DRAFT_111189 [Aspergillus candidus]PLB34967.1 hypothetical protein BDW47DRAFT_111189 [Aspergillus candidus]
MSFLDSVLSSIDKGQPARMPPTSSAPPAPVSSSTAKPEARKPATASRNAPSDQKTVASGMKRKAEEQLPRPQRPAPPDSNKPSTSRPLPSATLSKPRPIAKPSSARPVPARATTGSSLPTPQKAPQKPPQKAPQKEPPASSKAPPKGSFADLIAQAKNLQQKTPTQVGMFKHQPVPKEKLSKMERKKRMMEAQAKEKEAKLGKRPGAASGTKPGLQKLASKTAEPTYRGTSRPTPTPTATAPAQPAYRGTAGLPSRRSGNDRNAQSRGGRRRMDEYLGTDEEDEGEYADNYDDYYSDASSDMEAGLDDVDREEAAALKAARREDEEEWKAELAAKQEKLERRNRLASLASRRG